MECRSNGVMEYWGDGVRQFLDKKIPAARILSTMVLIISCLLPQSICADDPLTDLLDGIKRRYGQLPGLSIPYKRDVVTRSMASCNFA